MALYTGFIAVHYIDNAFDRASFVDISTFNDTPLSIDFSPYVVESSSSIEILDSIFDLFTLYPYSGKISFQSHGTTTLSFQTTNLIQDGSEVFRNQTELNAMSNDSLYTTDFSLLVVPPVPSTLPNPADLGSVLSILNSIDSRLSTGASDLHSVLSFFNLIDARLSVFEGINFSSLLSDSVEIKKTFTEIKDLFDIVGSAYFSSLNLKIEALNISDRKRGL